MPVDFEDPQFSASFEQSVALYTRYQMTIHGDDPSECSESEVLYDCCCALLKDRAGRVIPEQWFHLGPHFLTLNTFFLTPKHKVQLGTVSSL